MTVSCEVNDGIAEITMDNPPVNAITIADTWKVRDSFAGIAQRDDVRAVILTARGRGFNAGIDIREMQESELSEMERMISSGEACFWSFKEIYDCPVPVIAAVNGHCLGLGVGLAGSSDMIVASTNARFGLPELDNGALGCASHLARLVPPLRLRQMVFTCEPVGARELEAWGAIYKVVEPEDLMDTARALANTISQKPAHVVRATKQALNHIDPFDLHGSYRLEQGFTYQMNLMGEGSQARNAFVRGERTVTR